jgi:putative membrane protein
MDASQSDKYEIEAARVAEVEGRDPRVRSFAQQMIVDHARLDEDLRRAAAASGMSPPQPGMSSDEAALLSSLQSVRGADFDRTYARQQALAHAQAVAVEGSFATAGLDPNLRKAAQSALPMIQDHLRGAQQLRDQVGAP